MRLPGREASADRGPVEGGPPSGFCSAPEHNAQTLFAALKRGEARAPAETAVRLGLDPGGSGGG